MAWSDRRGASDGWDRDPTVLAEQMCRLHRVT